MKASLVLLAGRTCYTPIVEGQLQRDHYEAVYRFPATLKEAQLVKRINRFLAEVEISGKRELAHIPHTGRLPDLLVPASKCYLAPALHPERRKTRWTLTLIEKEHRILGCIDTSVPNKLLRILALSAQIPGLQGWKYWAHEIQLGKSRVDLALAKGNKYMFVEVKSVTWVIEGFALFPDAPTTRGIKHLENLIRARSEGFECAMAFVIQRQDANRLRIAEFIHPKYLRTAISAKKLGVRFVGLRCLVNPVGVSVLGEVPVELRPPPTRIRAVVESVHLANK